MNIRNYVRMLLVPLALAGTFPALASVVYVNKNATSSTHDGKSWITALLTVRAGVNAAQSGDEVWVAANLYVENLTVPAGVALYGGFAGTETNRAQRNWKTNVTVLDGNKSDSVVWVSDAVTQAAIVDGFVIRNASSGVDVSGSATIANDIITGCTESDWGGVSVWWGGNATIVNSVISQNSTNGISVHTGSISVVNSTICDNLQAGIYLDAASATITNSIIAFNSGGINALSANSVWLTYSDVFGNTSYNVVAEAYNFSAYQTIAEDPLPANRTAFDYHLQQDSPCIDTGNDSSVQPGEMDLDGKPRIYSAHVDMGALEYVPSRNRVYVSANAAGTVRDGRSWATPFLTIQEGIDMVDPGGEVWVGKGTYTGTGLRVKPGVTLLGGFAGNETSVTQRISAANVTLLDGNADSGGFAPAPIMEVLGGGITIDRFTFRNGSEFTGPGSTGTPGAAIRYDNHAGCSDAFTISHNDIGTCVGSAIYCGVGSVPTITENRIHDNTRGVEGGGIRLNGSVAVVRDNILDRNAATTAAGAIRVYASIATLTNNTIVNSPGTTGISISSLGRSVACANNVISFNAGGIDVDLGTSVGGVTWRNNDVYSNSSWNYNGLADQTGSNGNICEDPGFVNAAVADYHLQANSPCVDAGNDTVVANGETDFDGNARVLGPHADMGGYEYYPSGVIFVNKKASGATHNGTSWSNACLTVQGGINAAKAGDEVWVAGSYTESVTLGNGVALYGGFTGTETQRNQRNWKTNVTSLSGNGYSSVVIVTSGCGRDTVLDGFLITGGTGTTVATDQKAGGGIYCKDASPTIANNTISGNRCVGRIEYSPHEYDYGGGSGGGVYLENSDALIKGNTITSNTCWDDGGGILVVGGAPEIRGNVISNNIAESYAYNYMAGSSDGGSGGGIECSGSAALIVGNTISGNKCPSPGGGVFANGGSVRISGNRITGNTALGAYRYGYSLGGYGGGVYANAGVMADNLIANNNAQTMGGGVRATGTAIVSNCTIVLNTAIDGGGIALNGSGAMSNSIIAYNTTGLYLDTAAGVASHCDVTGNITYDYKGIPDATGTNGNISGDPLFTSVAGSDYLLGFGSPCINAGDDSVVTSGETDLDGNPRILGAHVDIGAYEHRLPVFTVADAASALRIAGGLAVSTDLRLNVDGVAGVTTSDAVRIARKVAGLEANP